MVDRNEVTVEVEDGVAASTGSVDTRYERRSAAPIGSLNPVAPLPPRLARERPTAPDWNGRKRRRNSPARALYIRRPPSTPKTCPVM